MGKKCAQKINVIRFIVSKFCDGLLVRPPDDFYNNNQLVCDHYLIACLIFLIEVRLKLSATAPETIQETSMTKSNSKAQTNMRLEFGKKK